LGGNYLPVEPECEVRQVLPSAQDPDSLSAAPKRRGLRQNESFGNLTLVEGIRTAFR
jgi:hypothetical protein